MGRRINDGDVTGLKQDKYRNSRFELEEEREPSWYYGGASRSSANTLGGPFNENRGRRSANTVRSQWDGSPYEDQELSNWRNKEGWDRYYNPNYERGSRKYGGAQLQHDGGNFAGKGPKGYRRSDKTIFEDVCDTLKLSPGIDASQVEVSVKDGVVYLNGTVPDRRTKKLAELEIENISGVDDVQNLLRFRQDKKDLH